MVFEILGSVSAAVWMVFLVVNFVVLLVCRDKNRPSDYNPPVSVIIPAYNEEKYIGECLGSVFSARYKGKKEVIVVDDGSEDRTPEIVKSFKGVRYIRTNRLGKAGALNKALQIAKNNIVITIDADSVIEKSALENIVKPLKNKDTGAATGIIKVRGKKNILVRFQNIEYMFFNLFTRIWDKANSNITVRGPISAFKKDLLFQVGGFDTDIDAMEDTAAAIKIIRLNYKIRVVENAVSHTFTPNTLKGFVKQRLRWAKGGVQLLKRNRDFYFRNGNPSKFSFPMITYWYVNPVIFLVFFLGSIASGYYMYFIAKGEIISYNVAVFFLNWFSLLGVANLLNGMLYLNYPINFINISAIVMFLISYGFYAYSMKRYKADIDWKDAFPLFFLSTYWIVLNIIYFVTLIYWIKPGNRGRNIWKK